jgi:transcriptional regulator with XRE-family HTH domain
VSWDLLGLKIHKHRKEKGFSLEKLAEISRVSKSHIWELENTFKRNPTIDKLARISDALGVTTVYLIGDAELTDEVLEKAFFEKFNKLNYRDKKRIEQLIGLWGNGD